MENNTRINKNSASLISVQEIPVKYRKIFQDFTYFNIVQSTVFQDVFRSDQPIVVSAPTGAGKTVVFELAIVRLLQSYEQVPFKLVYIAPLKAVCEERLVDWNRKFADFGLSCISVTGDSDNVELQLLINHNIIITTPEKWDSLTRKWRDNSEIVQLVKLFMLDEVHLLNEDCRGSTLEAIVSRMKIIQETYCADNRDGIRFLAISATIPNLEDIGEWLGGNQKAKIFKFDETVRPVQLKKVVLGYHYNPQTSTPFKFDIALNYKLPQIILQYSQGKPVLIFCSTRKSVEMTSKYLSQNLTITFTSQQKETLQKGTATLADGNLRQMVLFGVSYHHAGVRHEDRVVVEELFRSGCLPVLVATSTLAMGVNLPAHLVIVKFTRHYINGSYQDYDDGMVLQMIGRAGRPQYDTEATAVILTTLTDKAKYENMVCRKQPLESTLHKHLTEHLNAEIVLSTITDLGVAMKWLASTFLHIRARKNPKHYRLSPELTPEQIDRKLLEMCQIEINKLIRTEMIVLNNEDQTIVPTITGSLMAQFYIAFETMKLFKQINGGENLAMTLALISKSKEFSEIYLRVSDKKCLNLLNKCKNGKTIRFPFNSVIKTVDMKINCLIQAVFDCLPIADSSLFTETQKIMRIGERVCKCLVKYLENREKCFSALLSALILSQCFHTKIWENSPFITKQLTGIGNVYSSNLAKGGLTTFQEILNANPRHIEQILNKKGGAGNFLQEQVMGLPQYECLISSNKPNFLTLKITLKNPAHLNQSIINLKSTMTLIIGDNDNNILYYKKYSHNSMIRYPEIFNTFKVPFDSDKEIQAHFISEDWAGIDCNVNFITNTRQKKIADEAKQSQKKKTTKSVKGKENTQTVLDSFFLEKSKEPVVINELNAMERVIDKTLEDYYKIKKKTNFVTQKEQSDEIAEVTSTIVNPIIIEETPNQSNMLTKEQENSVVHKRKYEEANVNSSYESPQQSDSTDSLSKKSDNNSKSLKTVSWKSPLVSFPLSNNRFEILTKGNEETKGKIFDFEQFKPNSPEKFSYASCSNTQNSNMDLQKQEFNGPNQKLKRTYPLADKCYNDREYTQKSANNSNNSVQEIDMNDTIVSTSIFKKLGLLNPEDQSPKVQDSPKSVVFTKPSNYYSQLHWTSEKKKSKTNQDDSTIDTLPIESKLDLTPEKMDPAIEIFDEGDSTFAQFSLSPKIYDINTSIPHTPSHCSTCTCYENSFQRENCANFNFDCYHPTNSGFNENPFDLGQTTNYFVPNSNFSDHFDYPRQNFDSFMDDQSSFPIRSPQFPLRESSLLDYKFSPEFLDN